MKSVPITYLKEQRALEFDEHLTSPARLALVAALVPGDVLTFTELKRATGLADGNLHVQSKKLADAGYVEIIKGRRGGRSLTRFRLTEQGLGAFKLHVRKLQGILATEMGGTRRRAAIATRDASQVWSQ